MAVTQNTYTGNGSTVLFSFTFPYLETTDIKVSVNGTTTTAYTLANATTIQFNTAPANGAAIRIYRETDDTGVASTFFAGSAIRAQDLNSNFTQTLYLSQESVNEADSATATANSALTNSNTAISTANSAVSTANSAVSTANSAVSTANSASTNASAAVTTANTASSNASAAVSTANAASATAASAVTTANSAVSTANGAVSTANAANSTANTALTAANSAVSTANTASTNASNAVSTANTANTNASTAVSTANTASTNASTAVSTANTANTKADQAIAAVSNSINFQLKANVAAIPASPANDTYIEVQDSTGLESFTPLAGKPAGFVGDAGLSVRLRYTTAGTTWNWLNYYANDSDARFLKKTGGTMTGKITLDGNPSANLHPATKQYVDAADATLTSAAAAAQSTANTAVTNAATAQSPANTAVTNAAAAQATADAALPKAGGTATGNISAPAFIPTGSTAPTNGVYLPAANSVAISTNGTGRLFVNSSGSVGIGTSSPSRQLDVLVADNTTYAGNADNANALNLFNTSTTNETFSSIRLGSQGSGSAGLVTLYGVQTANASGSGYFAIATRNAGTFAERFRITPGGNVGIGSTSPDVLITAKQTNAGATGATLRLVNASTTVNSATKLAFTNTTSETADSAAITAVRTGVGQYITFSLEGNEAVRIDESRRLLVGTSSSRSNNLGSNFQIQLEGTGGDTAGLAIVRNSANAGAPYLVLGKTRSGSVGGSTAVSNNDGLGEIHFTGSDGTNLVDAAAITAARDGSLSTGSCAGRLVFSVTRDGQASPTPTMQIGNSGQIGTFSSNYGIEVATSQGAGTTYTLFTARHSASGFFGGTVSYQVWSNGNVVNTNNSYGAISDLKLKENIADANSQWSDIKALQVRKYNFKEGQTHTQIGLIAQEVELVSPGLVSESPDRDEDGNDLGTVTKSVNYSVLYMKAVKALQEAMERIEQLEAKVAALEAS